MTSNQLTPLNQGNLGDVLRVHPTTVTCPSCRSVGVTRVENECNLLNLLCFCCTTPVTWILFQVLRGKDINCQNATHRCGSCGALLGTYEAC